MNQLSLPHLPAATPRLDYLPLHDQSRRSNFFI